jgi:hypothetical protein
VHTGFPHPRRQTDRASRTPPTIVRGRQEPFDHGHHDVGAYEYDDQRAKEVQTSGPARMERDHENASARDYDVHGDEQPAEPVGLRRRRGGVLVQWRHLTVKLRGRTEAPNGAEGAQFLSARGAKAQAHHGPLQRLLAAMTKDAKFSLLSECGSYTHCASLNRVWKEDHY